MVSPFNVPDTAIDGGGTGFTVIENVTGLLPQLRFAFAFAMTVIVALIGLLPLLIQVNAGISPFPLAAKPIQGVSLVQV